MDLYDEQSCKALQTSIVSEVDLLNVRIGTKFLAMKPKSKLTRASSSLICLRECVEPGQLSASESVKQVWMSDDLFGVHKLSI